MTNLNDIKEQYAKLAKDTDNDDVRKLAELDIQRIEITNDAIQRLSAEIENIPQKIHDAMSAQSNASNN